MKKAFTLVELSIVLIIIGLIVASVTAGKGLIQTAKLQKVITEFDNLNKAVLGFVNEYGELPGDFTEAHLYWGYDCDGGSTTTDDCSGDGDGLIDEQTEGVRAMYHLNLSEYIAESLSTPAANGTIEPDVGVNIPRSSWPGAGISIFGNSLFSSALLLGGEGASTTFVKNNVQIMTAAQARFLDKKIDDALPNSGILRGSGFPGAEFNGASDDNDMVEQCSDCTRTCTNDADTLSGTATCITDCESANYDVDDTTLTCAPAFIINS